MPASPKTEFLSPNVSKYSLRWKNECMRELRALQNSEISLDDNEAVDFRALKSFIRVPSFEDWGEKAYSDLGAEIPHDASRHTLALKHLLMEEIEVMDDDDDCDDDEMSFALPSVKSKIRVFDRKETPKAPLVADDWSVYCKSFLMGEIRSSLELEDISPWKSPTVKSRIVIPKDRRHVEIINAQESEIEEAVEHTTEEIRIQHSWNTHELTPAKRASVVEKMCTKRKPRMLQRKLQMLNLLKQREKIVEGVSVLKKDSKEISEFTMNENVFRYMTEQQIKQVKLA